MEEENLGGGASETTEPAAGTSAATDVSLLKFTSRDLWWLDRHFTQKLYDLKQLFVSQRASDQEALKVALRSSKELLDKHNDLIRQQEKKDANYATKDSLARLESWQQKVTGGLILFSFIGVANLVKLWLT